jgi:hypothetical protein
MTLETKERPRSEPEPRRSGPLLGWRAVVSALLLAAAVGYFVAMVPALHGKTDFRPIWYSATALVEGGNPYTATGPTGTLYRFSWPQLYPVTAFLLIAPLTAVGEHVAFVLFVSLSAGLLAYAVARDDYRLIPMFLSASFLHAAILGQWSPLLLAATLMPVLGFVLVAKPTIGLALFVYRPTRAAIVGGAVLIALSLAVRPSWPVEWIERLTSHAGNMLMPVTRWAGPLVLLAALRWRRPEARLLLALSVIPQTLTFYEMLPLFLIAANAAEALLLAALSWAALLIYDAMAAPELAFVEKHQLMSQLLVALMYVPATILVLRRPNRTSRDSAAPPHPAAIGTRHSADG